MAIQTKEDFLRCMAMVGEGEPETSDLLDWLRAHGRLCGMGINPCRAFGFSPHLYRALLTAHHSIGLTSYNPTYKEARKQWESETLPHVGEMRPGVRFPLDWESDQVALVPISYANRQMMYPRKQDITVHMEDGDENGHRHYLAFQADRCDEFWLGLHGLRAVHLVRDMVGFMQDPQNRANYKIFFSFLMQGETRYAPDGLALMQMNAYLYALRVFCRRWPDFTEMHAEFELSEGSSTQKIGLAAMQAELFWSGEFESPQSDSEYLARMDLLFFFLAFQAMPHSAVLRRFGPK